MKVNVHSETMHENNEYNGERSEEQGFILIAVIVILAILTIVGAVSVMKSTVEIKVSAESVLSEQALAAANTGLAHNYAYWSWNVQATAETADGTAAKGAVATAAAAGTATAGIYDEAATGTTMPTDANIRTGATAYRVYDIDPITGNMTKVARTTWATVNTPQVAVWATRFYKQTDPAYPYASSPATGTSTGCPDCNIAVYALGRAGPPPLLGPPVVNRDAHSLLREIQMTTKQELKGASALTNAPKYDDFQHACAGDTSSNGTPNASGAKVPTAWIDDTGFENTVIEATQAPYNRNLTDAKSNPSGTAIVSNTDLGGGGKGFRSGNQSATGASLEYTPMLAYSGHGPAGAANNVQVDLADVTLDTTVNYDNLPANELPHYLVKAPTMTTDYVDYFKDAKSQLFKLDVYRWAAEEFTCQDTSKANGANGNGRYCSKAEALRVATGNLPAMAGHVPVITTDAPVSGRLTMAEFEYNSNYGIPMFGMVRVMVPTTAGSTLTCIADGSNDVVSYKVSVNVSSLTTGHKKALPDPDPKKNKPGDFTLILNQYDGAANTLDGDGVLDDTARVLVYGSLLFDYFTDNGSGVAKNNGVFDPAAGERLLTPLESAESYMKIEFPILINPSMPRGTLGAFPTAAGGTITTGSSVKPVNLASPTAGYFPTSEGLLVPTGSGNYKDGLAGTMRLMSNGLVYSNGVNSPVIANDPGPNAADGVDAAPNNITMPTDGLISVSKAIKGSADTVMNTKAAALFTTHKADLKYYYNLMVKNAKQSDVASWPIAPFPADLTEKFAIGQEDCGNPSGSTKVCGDGSYNQGDALHLLFPSGYMHGWKVALAALDLKAADWNGIFTNLDTDLATQHLTAKDYGDAARPKGSPFNANVGATGDVPATCGGSTCTWAKWIAEVKNSESDYFYVDTSAGGYGLLTEKWKDIPAEMYVGGLLDMHAHANINGVVYTPGPLEWEPGNSSYGFNSDHLAYINGAIITGFGAYVKNGKQDNAGVELLRNARYVLVYSNDAVDNINTSNAIPTLARFARQSL